MSASITGEASKNGAEKQDNDDDDDDAEVFEDEEEKLQYNKGEEETEDDDSELEEEPEDDDAEEQEEEESDDDNNNAEGKDDHEEKHNDEDEFRVNGDCIPVVNGQQMKRGMLLTGRTDGLEQDPVLRSATTRFTAAAGFDMGKFVKNVVGTNDIFHPSTRLFGVVMLWSPRKTKKHFFNDAYFSQKVFSEEIGADSFVDFLALRGWSVKRQKKKDGEIEIDFC
jgi:hypothetical protein